MKNNILWPLHAACSRLEAIVCCELKILIQCFNVKNKRYQDIEPIREILQETLQKAREAEDPSTVSFACIAQTLKTKCVPDEAQCNLRNLGLNQFHGILKKITFSLYALLMEDTMKFILEYGPFPRMKVSGDKDCGPHLNKIVKIYCR